MGTAASVLYMCRLPMSNLRSSRTDRDGPQLFVTDLLSDRFFPTRVVHSVKPYRRLPSSGGFSVFVGEMHSHSHASFIDLLFQGQIKGICGSPVENSRFSQKKNSEIANDRFMKDTWTDLGSYCN
uniref:Uncharacterized protein n=1 Tax=Noccaea caerulescens TaxID=107243 RepID=A0A1J3D6C4_NOCCA